MSEFTLRFGALAPMIEDQIKKQGVKFKLSTMSKSNQELADAITRLNICGLLPDGETHKARGRLMKRITSDVEAIE